MTSCYSQCLNHRSQTNGDKVAQLAAVCSRATLSSEPRRVFFLLRGQYHSTYPVRIQQEGTTIETWVSGQDHFMMRVASH